MNIHDSYPSKLPQRSKINKFIKFPGDRNWQAQFWKMRGTSLLFAEKPVIKENAINNNQYYLRPKENQTFQKTGKLCGVSEWTLVTHNEECDGLQGFMMRHVKVISE